MLRCRVCSAGAPVAQWIEHQPPELRATGSNPVRRTIRSVRHTTIDTYRTPVGPLAQLVEQLTLNQRAVGSTPTRPTKPQFRYIRDHLIALSVEFIQQPLPLLDKDLPAQPTSA